MKKRKPIFDIENYGNMTGFTSFIGGPLYNAEYDPDRDYNKKVYSKKNMDDVFEMLTLLVKNKALRKTLNESYQNWKDSEWEREKENDDYDDLP